jgi:hypothetical protein
MFIQPSQTVPPAAPRSRHRGRELWDMSKREEGTFSRSDFKFD